MIKTEKFEVIERAERIIEAGIKNMDQKLLSIFLKVQNKKADVERTMKDLESWKSSLKDALDRNDLTGIASYCDTVKEHAELADNQLESLEEWVYVFEGFMN